MNYYVTLPTVSGPSAVSTSSLAPASWLWVTLSGGRPWTGSAAMWGAPAGDGEAGSGTPCFENNNLAVYLKTVVTGETRTKENTLLTMMTCPLLYDVMTL